METGDADMDTQPEVQGPPPRGRISEGDAMSEALEMRIARAFAANLKDLIGEASLQEAVRRNVLSEGADVSHINDFCNPDTAMQFAFRAVLGRDPDLSFGADVKLWDDAWNIAEDNEFWVSPLPPREYLRLLVKRSGVSQAEIARRMGFASTAGFNRYVRADTQGNRPIAPKIVAQLAQIIVGTGSPWAPITHADLFPLLTGDEAIPEEGCPICNRAKEAPAPIRFVFPAPLAKVIREQGYWDDRLHIEEGA